MRGPWPSSCTSGNFQPVVLCLFPGLWSGSDQPDQRPLDQRADYWVWKLPDKTFNRQEKSTWVV